MTQTNICCVDLVDENQHNLTNILIYFFQYWRKSTEEVVQLSMQSCVTWMTVTLIQFTSLFLSFQHKILTRHTDFEIFLNNFIQMFTYSYQNVSGVIVSKNLMLCLQVINYIYRVTQENQDLRKLEMMTVFLKQNDIIILRI